MVDLQRGIRAAGVDEAMSVSCMRLPRYLLSVTCMPRVGCRPRVDISMSMV